MKVRLVSDISGTRDGKPWPPAGQEVDLPDQEALALVQNGSAKAVNSKDADQELRTDEGLDEATKQAVKRATTTRDRTTQSKRAHEPLNADAADDDQPDEDENGPRAEEVPPTEPAVAQPSGDKSDQK